MLKLWLVFGNTFAVLFDPARAAPIKTARPSLDRAAKRA